MLNVYIGNVYLQGQAYLQVYERNIHMIINVFQKNENTWLVFCVSREKILLNFDPFGMNIGSMQRAAMWLFVFKTAEINSSIFVDSILQT